MTRDGIPYWFKGGKPKVKKNQYFERDENVKNQVREKLSSDRKRVVFNPVLLKA